MTLPPPLDPDTDELDAQAYCARLADACAPILTLYVPRKREPVAHARVWLIYLGNVELDPDTRLLRRGPHRLETRRSGGAQPSARQVMAGGRGRPDRDCRLDPETASRIQRAEPFVVAQEHFEKVLQNRFSFELTEAIGAVLAGTRPVKAVIDVRHLDVPSVVRRVLIDDNAKIRLQVDLVDARTGQVVLPGREALKFEKMVGGFGAPIAASMSAGTPSRH